MSFTRDSKATAATMPSWCSEASMWRVPKRIAKIAMTSATQSAVSASSGTFSCSGMATRGYCRSTLKEVETAFSCSEM